MNKAYIPVIDPKEATGLLKRVYRRIGGSRGSIANVHQCQSLNPKAMNGHLDLYMATVYSEDSPLTRIERELIATWVSTINNCHYCIVHHHEALKALWSDAPTPEILLEGKLDDKLNILRKHIRKLVEQPHKIVESDISRLHDAGYNDRGILDITLITSYFCFVNRLTLGLGVVLEKDTDRDYKY